MRTLCAQKSYLEAAQLISDCSKMLESEYREIAGLNEIKRVVNEERVKLEKHLVQELTDQLYTTVSKLILENGSVVPNRDASFKRRFRHHLTAKDNVDQFDPANESSGPNQQQQFSNEVLIERLVEAAAKLNSSEANVNILEKMINDINAGMNTQLIGMVNATSANVVESNLIDSSKLIYLRSGNSFGVNGGSSARQQFIENNPKFLCQLIDLVFEQFKLTAKYYRFENFF